MPLIFSKHMRKLGTTSLLIATLLFVASCNEAHTIIPSNKIYVVDGDTIDVDGTRYRLTGYDTPETYRAKCGSERDLGNAATARLRAMIAGSTSIELSIESNKDKYGRRLGRLFINGIDVGKTLIDEDLARPYFGGQRQSWC